MTTESRDEATESGEDTSYRDAALPKKISRREIARVVIRITGVPDLLEIEGDDVDLGTDLKVRYHHKVVAEFRRDAIDGWWFKSNVVNGGPPFGGEGDASDVGDVAESDAGE
jgi:hypothetical protein